MKHYFFYDIYFAALNKHSKITTKRVKSQFKPTWITPEINEARHKRDHFHKIKEENYRLCRNKVTSFIQSAKEQYYRKALLDENENISDIWRYMKEITPKQNHYVPNSLRDNTSEMQSH